MITAEGTEFKVSHDLSAVDINIVDDYQCDDGYAVFSLTIPEARRLAEDLNNHAQWLEDRAHV